MPFTCKDFRHALFLSQQAHIQLLMQLLHQIHNLARKESRQKQISKERIQNIIIYKLLYIRLIQPKPNSPKVLAPKVQTGVSVEQLC